MVGGDGGVTKWRLWCRKRVVMQNGEVREGMEGKRGRGCRKEVKG